MLTGEEERFTNEVSAWLLEFHGYYPAAKDAGRYRWQSQVNDTTVAAALELAPRVGQ